METGRTILSADAVRARRRPLRPHALPANGSQRSSSPGHLARPVVELRARPPTGDEPRDRAARFRPRRYALRPREQLRAAVRLCGGELRRAHAKSEEVADSAEHQWHEVQSDWDAHIKRIRERIDAKQDKVDAAFAENDAKWAEGDAITPSTSRQLRSRRLSTRCSMPCWRAGRPTSW